MFDTDPSAEILPAGLPPIGASARRPSTSPSERPADLFGGAPLLLTGATGFLGRALVRRLLAAGLPAGRLRCLVRDPERAMRVTGLPRECLFRADLGANHAAARREAAGEPSALHAAADGVGLVVHLAGSLKAFHRRGFDAVNVHGTARLVAAVCDAAPAAHFVHTSSLAAAGPSVDGAGTDRPADECQTVSHYGESKRLGELAVVRSGLSFTVLRPPVVYGPNDGATRLLFQQATAVLAAVPRTSAPLSVIHADDVAEALWLAVRQRPPGAYLPLDGPDRTDTYSFVRAIAEACQKQARLVRVPMPVACLAAHGADLWARLRRAPGYFNRDKVREIAAKGWVADGSAARRLLGFEPLVGLEAGLRGVAEVEGRRGPPPR
ncbi:MAG: NAD-dependent epimerase/dehydratase family protein [Planctomycetota bacterium]